MTMKLTWIIRAIKRRFLCRYGIHQFNQYPGDQGGKEGIGGHYATWRPAPGGPYRKFGTHCKLCGEWRIISTSF